MKLENRKRVKEIEQQLIYIEKWLEDTDVTLRYKSDTIGTYNEKSMRMYFIERNLLKSDAEYRSFFKEIETMRKITKDLFKAKLEELKEKLEKELEKL